MDNDLARDVLEAENEQDEITAQARSVDKKDRKRLTMDDLVHMVDIRPRVEYRTPRSYPVNGTQKYAWIMSIDGWLNGVELHGCSLGDEFAVVFAVTEREAMTIAHEGILKTTIHAYEHWYAESVEKSPVKTDDGLIVDAAGRKMKLPSERSRIADMITEEFKKVN